MQTETMDALDAIYTARAIRRLRHDPIPVEVLSRIIEAATMAPTNSNRQNWRFVVIDDRMTIGQLGEMYRERFSFAREMARSTLSESVFRSVDHLGEHFGDAPAVILVGGNEAFPLEGPIGLMATWYGGLFPAVQNIVLAARAHGIGTVITTMLTFGDQAELRALVGAPDDVIFVTAMPLGYPRGSFGRPPRAPVSDVAHLNRWGNTLPNPS